MKDLFNKVREFLKAYYEVFLVNYEIRWKRPSDEITKENDNGRNHD